LSLTQQQIQNTFGKSRIATPHAGNNYATESPLVTIWCPTFISKTVPLPSTITTNLIHPFLVRPSPPQTASRSNQPFFLNSPTWPTDRQTDRQMG